MPEHFHSRGQPSSSALTFTLTLHILSLILSPSELSARSIASSFELIFNVRSCHYDTNINNSNNKKKKKNKNVGTPDNPLKC